jgi:hypothetical protein
MNPLENSKHAKEIAGNAGRGTKEIGAMAESRSHDQVNAELVRFLAWRCETTL